MISSLSSSAWRSPVSAWRSARSDWTVRASVIGPHLQRDVHPGDGVRRDRHVGLDVLLESREHDPDRVGPGRHVARNGRSRHGRWWPRERGWSPGGWRSPWRPAPPPGWCRTRGPRGCRRGPGRRRPSQGQDRPQEGGHEQSPRPATGEMSRSHHAPFPTARRADGGRIPDRLQTDDRSSGKGDEAATRPGDPTGR